MTYRREVPLTAQDWRAEPFLGSESREDRSRLADFMAQRREVRAPSLSAVIMQHPELDHGYMAKVRRKIIGLPVPEPVDIRPRFDRAIGDRR